MMRAALVAMALLACKSQRSEEGATPVPAPVVSERILANELTAIAQSKAAGFRLTRIEVVNLQSDGMLDRKSGRAVFRFTRAGAELPVGGGSSGPRPDDCPSWTWASGTWTASPSHCSKEQIVAVHCSLLAVWDRAIDDGAPSAGRARLLMVARSAFDEPPPLWTIEISDASGAPAFRATYLDDCKAAAEAPELPVNLPERITLDELNRIIQAPASQAKIKACQLRHPKWSATLHLRITGPGQVTIESVEEGASELSECLRGALATFPFPRTRHGSPRVISTM